jgi:restriction system protein
MTPLAFEKFVRNWIDENLGIAPPQVAEVTHLGMIESAGGTYEIDVLVKFRILQDLRIIVLAECKHANRPVEHGEMQMLESKLRDVGAHKGIVFSTSGFQSGAIEYARAHGIGAVTVTGLKNEPADPTAPGSMKPELPPKFKITV